MDHIPSIFNDVVGPVMRGPSSSHSAAALRIGRMCRDLMDGDPGHVLVKYDHQDALATTHESQGSDFGMKGGLLGYEPDDQRLLHTDEQLIRAGIEIIFEVTDTGSRLPNHYLVHLRNSEDEIQVSALSTGGGMIELIGIDGVIVSMKGDCFETLVFSGDMDFLHSIGKSLSWADQVAFHQGNRSFAEIKSRQSPEPRWIKSMRDHPTVQSLRLIEPVLPIRSVKENKLPFQTYKQMLQYNEKRQLTAWELATRYESARGCITGDEVFNMMKDLYGVLRDAVNEGLKGTHFEDRILGAQSKLYRNRMEGGNLAGGEALHNITMYVSALMEVKSSFGTIVAAPTAGSCGTLPGAVLGVADSLKRGDDVTIRALLSGCLVGLFIASGSTFSAEIGGCQAECGSAGGMAAAAIVELMGGSLEQCMAAASMALQNSLGMICDPIAARVEAPCLGKNISAASNALVSANMALAGYDHLIPLDEVIQTMDIVGKSIPVELRCTALGGLSVTPAAKELEKKLKK
ncbi:MAG: L-serine ammonia-lyase, iron-sulfur-dependent, subunit alpha [Bacteroidales bacterium]|nr:L-serine ammonia-lyase, iron-sulfur-dependent, subunit alpha [Bacteroidales bacterium]